MSCENYVLNRQTVSEFGPTPPLGGNTMKIGIFGDEGIAEKREAPEVFCTDLQEGLE
jgi:hypothetical protein